jgi:hypothetical protein
MVEKLPENLSTLSPESLRHAAKVHDERISPLFRRWPSLSRLETAELKRLYNERLRVAKYLGKRR